MPRKVVIAGLVFTVACPLVAAVGLWLSQFMPGCTGGSSGPAAGCYLHGVNFNWFVHLATLAFLGSFFAVPLGLVVTLIGTVMLLLANRKARQRPYGIYDPQGKLLSLSEAAVAINQFDREACDGLLRAFGRRASSEAEPLQTVRLRCAETLRSVPPDAA
jgi:hypothetical protein